MAGSSISITIDDQSLMDALNQVIAKTTNLQPAFADIGEYLDLTSRQRFDTATAPDGCVFQTKPATDSTAKLPPVQRA